MDAVPRTRCAGLVLVLSLMLVTDGVTRINLFAGKALSLLDAESAVSSCSLKHSFARLTQDVAAKRITC